MPATRHPFFCMMCLVVVSYAIGIQSSNAQPLGQGNAANRVPANAPVAAINMEAEKEQIWNSANMLRARAWLQDYCSKSVKVTPEMAKEYQAELANMTPKQMKLWLLKFDEQEEQMHQQSAMFQQANAAGLQQAMAAHRQTQQAYSALNQASTSAAQNAQSEITEQREQAQSNFENNQLMQTPAYNYPYYGGYGAYGYGPYGGGGIHYHYHLGN